MTQIKEFLRRGLFTVIVLAVLQHAVIMMKMKIPITHWMAYNGLCLMMIKLKKQS